ncbi:MAG: glycosyltransferase [Methylomicrobium sp.]
MKTLVSYHHFPHYRKGVFEELFQRYSEITLITSELGSFAGIPSMQPTGGCKLIWGRGLWFKGLHFQPRLVIESIVGEYDVYVLLANPNFISTWFAAILARLRGKRVVFWGHGFFTNENSFKNIVRRCFFSLANCFYSYGYRSKLIAKSFGFASYNLYVGFNSLDYSRQLQIRQQVSVDSSPGSLGVFSRSGALKIICVSRLTEICRYELLFDAIALVRNRCDLDIEVVMVGDGPSRDQLEKMAAELNINVKFLGAIYDDNLVGAMIYTADITVSPGKVGLTAMHSLMFGTPVISHANVVEQMPEVEAVVDKKTGLLFNQWDVYALADALIEAKSCFADKDKVRMNCYTVIDQVYNPKKQVDVLLNAINCVPADEGDDVLHLSWFEQSVK